MIDAYWLIGCVFVSICIITLMWLDILEKKRAIRDYKNIKDIISADRDRWYEICCKYKEAHLKTKKRLKRLVAKQRLEKLKTSSYTDAMAAQEFFEQASK